MRSKIIALTGACLALSLGGCISLFPKAEPVQLYTFKAATAAAAATPKPAYSVLRGPTSFTRASASDRILTRNGTETAYIKSARWAAPAPVLFDEALAAAFDNSPVRLATRGEPAATNGVLRVEVRSFEARYTNGMEAAPTAYVEARATLMSLDSRTVLETKVFTAEQTAADNRVGPIVDAYDHAVGQILQQVVLWTGETMKPRGTP